jgi:hypothetical protein
MIKIIMDSSKEYEIKLCLDEALEILCFYNSMLNKEVLKNDLVRIAENVLINPNHISSIEEVC